MGIYPFPPSKPTPKTDWILDLMTKSCHRKRTPQIKTLKKKKLNKDKKPRV